MSEMFQKIIVIGYGKVTGEVLRYTKGRQNDFKYQMLFIEHEIRPFSVTQKICQEQDIPYLRLEDKKELAAYFQAVQEKTLIISASNNFLFPRELVEKENITIMNFHNALLPDYPGRNAPSWVIYAGEETTGITWHYVTAGVDEGDIIIQKKCEIGADTKAYELAEKLMNLAYEAFAECFDAVMEERVNVEPQGFAVNRKMYRSNETPSDGFFEMERAPEEIYRLLRSVDYGKNDIFPRMQTIINGKRVEILRYRKIPAAKRKEEEGNFLYLPLDAGTLLKLKYMFCD